MTCDYCGAKAANTYLCADCITELGTSLLDLIAGPPNNGHPSQGLLADLQDAAAGRTRFSEPAPHPAGASTNTGPRLNLAASRLQSTIHAQMMRIAASLPVCDTIWRPPHSRLPADFIGPLRPNECRLPPSAYRPSTIELVIWLAGHTRTIAHQPDAAQTMRDIRRIIRRIQAIIDRPQPTQPAGHCDCGNPLRAAIDATETTCPHCGIVANIAERQRQLLGELVNQGTAFSWQELPVVFCMLGLPFTARTFRHWRKNGRLTIAGYNRDNQPLYRPAELITPAV